MFGVGVARGVVGVAVVPCAVGVAPHEVSMSKRQNRVAICLARCVCMK